MSTFRWASWIVIVALSLGCGDDSDSGSSVIEAPSSLAGRTIDATITSGSGVFATTGTFKIFILGLPPSTTYEIERNGVMVVTNSGTYTYSAAGAVGTMSFADSVIGEGTFTFTYTRRELKVGVATTSAGTFSASAAVGGTQTGTFVSTEPPRKPGT